MSLNDLMLNRRQALGLGVATLASLGLVACGDAEAPAPATDEDASEETKLDSAAYDELIASGAVAADDAISAGLASNNTGDHLKIVDVPDTTWSYGIAVKSGQDELVGQIDAALRAVVDFARRNKRKYLVSIYGNRGVNRMAGRIGMIPADIVEEKFLQLR